MNSQIETPDVGHRYTLHIDPQSVVGLKVECNYDPADERRPCWPHAEDGTRLEGKDAADCIYVDWVTNVDASDIMWGEMELEVDVEPKWRDDYMEFHLLGLSARVAVVRPPEGDVPADYETRRRLCNIIEDAAAEWQGSLSPRPLPEYLANVLGDAGVQVVAVVRPTRDQIAAFIINRRFGWVGDPLTLSAGETTYPSVKWLVDELIREGLVAVSDSQETPTQTKEH